MTYMYYKVYKFPLCLDFNGETCECCSYQNFLDCLSVSFIIQVDADIPGIEFCRIDLLGLSQLLLWLFYFYLCIYLFLAFSEDTLCVGVSRVGADDQGIQTGTLSSMTDVNLGPPLHSLVVVGKVHPLETDMLKLFAQDKDMVEKYAELA